MDDGSERDQLSVFEWRKCVDNSLEKRVDEKNTIRVGTYILPPGEEQSKKIKVKRPLLSDVASSASIMYFTASFPKKLNGGNTSTKWLDGSSFFHSCIVVNKIVCLALYYYALIKDFLQSSFFILMEIGKEKQTKIADLPVKNLVISGRYCISWDLQSTTCSLIISFSHVIIRLMRKGSATPTQFDFTVFCIMMSVY